MAHFQEKLFDAYDAAEEDYETHLATYVEELSQWWRIYQPDYDTSDCGGLVISANNVPEGEQSCYFNSYESVYMIMYAVREHLRTRDH